MSSSLIITSPTEPPAIAPGAAVLTLSDEERRKILFDWNATECSCDTDRCVHWLFEERVEASPQNLAVDDGDSRLVYADLNGRANQLAHHLRSLGIGRGSLVGVCMERSANLVVAVLGILKSGAAYVPMEPDWPDQRIELMTNSLGLRGIVIRPSQIARSIRLAPQIPNEFEIVCLEKDRVGTIQADSGASVQWQNDLPRGNLFRVESPDDRAYIIFTSGSTGHPKAVVVRHRPVINLIDWVNKTFGVCATDKMLFVTSIAFDLSVYDIFGILAAGATIRIAKADELFDPERISRILMREGITFWDSAPAALERLLPSLNCLDAPARVRLVFLSGDWIPLSLLPPIKRKFPHARMIALGGATEATVWSNFYEMNEIDPTWQSIPYGRPIQNARYYILDSEFNPCSVGTAGDLYIGGLCLADGYANDRELTAARFLPNPFVEDERIYRTGDRARYFVEGTIEFLGRSDRQVKIRGYRVEPAEIEAALQNYPGVVRAAVIAEGGACQAKQLVGYVVLDQQQPAAKAVALNIRRFLTQQLPHYMVPRQIVVLPSLPITENGKIDLASLRSSCHLLSQSSEEVTPPRTQIQQNLADIWCRVFRLDRIGIHESFFDLGGDSLQTVEMISAAARVGIEIRHQDLQSHPTISALAAACTNPLPRVSEIQPAGEIPLTPTQHWFFGRSLRFPERYNAVFAFEVVGEIDPEKLRLALHHLQIHHDALRLRFEFAGGKMVQLIPPRAVVPHVLTWDLSALSQDEHRDEIERRVALLRLSFNLQQGPLAKAVLLRKGPQEALKMLLVMHHLVFDAASLRMLVEDLTAIIDQLDRNVPVRLPGNGSFARWAKRLSKHAASTSLFAESSYWLCLPWEEVTRLPTDFRATSNCYRTSAVVRAELTTRETHFLLRDVPRRCGASVGEILLTVCVWILARWADCQVVFVDLTNHGRHELFTGMSLSRTVGYITSNTPIVMRIRTDSSLAEVVDGVRDHLRRMPSHGIGYGVLRYLSPINEAVESLHRCPQPEVKFNYLGSMSADALATSRFIPLSDSFPGVLDPQDERAYLHNLELAVIDGKLQLDWKYSTAAHRAKTIESLVAKYMAALREMLGEANPDDGCGIIIASARGHQ